ncbi:DUF3892 domain-containing protein [uncultured Sphingomonas sp.]|uniref:DUF3892 domain-containing protein n=1 Tax=uncultured Sphingomonas sp. TaxID=158754 RepID=UPI00344F04E4
MTTYRADCHSPDNLDLDRRIQGLGGTSPSAWWFGIDTIIAMISQEHVFYTMVRGQVALIVVKQHPVSRRKYLATAADGLLENNLLNLPRCPGAR